MIAQVPSVAAEAEGPMQVGAGTRGTVLAAWAGSDVALLLLLGLPNSPGLAASPQAPRTKSPFSRVTPPCRSQALVKAPVFEQERAIKGLFM